MYICIFSAIHKKSESLIFFYSKFDMSPTRIQYRITLHNIFFFSNIEKQAKNSILERNNVSLAFSED